MAAYKLVNADQLDSDLTTVGNAIRSKGGTSAGLSFPAGMVSAIGAISTGVELNFDVVPGLTQPGTAAENTIWVKTEKINNWYFSATQPEGMQERDVLFTTGTTSPVEYNALKKNGIQVYPITAKQYVNGALVALDASIYQSGVWTVFSQARYYLFKSGEGATVELMYVEEAYSTITATKTSIVTKFSGDESFCVKITNKNKINTAAYTKLYVEITNRDVASHQGEAYPLYIILTDTNTNIADDVLSSFDAAKKIPVKSSNQTLYLDISKYNSSYYLGVWGSADSTIYNMWME